MTPNDIATNIAGMGSAECGNITTSTNFTHSSTPSGYTMDDANTWD